MAFGEVSYTDISNEKDFCFSENQQYIYIYIFFFLNKFIYFYFWVCWVFVSVRGLSLVAASGGHSSSRCVGLSLSWPLLLGAQAPDAQAQ